MPSKKKPIDATPVTEKKYANPPEKVGTSFYGVRLDKEQQEFANKIWCDDYDIVFCNAKSGCGKTFIATGVADMLVKYGKYSSIVYIMSPYAEKKQGWLPGTIEEKSSVYFDAFFQALNKCRVNINTSVRFGSVAEQAKDQAYITCITDTYIRGINMDDAVIIIDEAQNYTVEQLRKTLTRAGSRTKIIIIGHDKQCDLDNKADSGFVRCIDHFKEKPRASMCELSTNHRGWVSQWADEM